MPPLILHALIGAAIGAAIGHFSKFSREKWPLIANWQRAALSGAMVGVVYFFVTGGGGSTAMNQSTPAVTHITEAEFNSTVMQSTKPVVVDFYATWCGPCKILSPRLDKLADSFTNEIKFVKVNIDESPKLAEQFNIQGIPALLFFKDGKVVDGTVGLLSSDALKARLEALAGTNAPTAG